MRRLIVAIIVIPSCLLSLHAAACSVPVFRYALERWERDPYPVVIVHRGEAPAVPENAKAYLEGLQDMGAIWFDTVDVATASRAATSLLAQVGDVPLPALAVLLPSRVEEYEALTVMPWEDVVLDKLKPVFESSARETVAKRILDGHTAVWVFLDGEDAARNKEALAQLEAGLRLMEEELKIPEQEDVTGYSGEKIAQLQVKFSTISLPHELAGNPGDRIFREMLLRVEPDLLKLKGPMAFPIFGRGRALFGLVNEGITENNIAEACSFLVGPCSCQIKAMNPGMDILFPVNWWDQVESLIQLNEDQPPPLVGYSGSVEAPVTNASEGAGEAATGTVDAAAVEIAVAIAEVAQATESSGASRALWSPIVLAVGAVVVLALLGSLLVRLKK